MKIPVEASAAIQANMASGGDGDDDGRVVVAPMDDHNTKLVAHTHPPDWVNPKPSCRYNLVVIGAGTAGLIVAAGAAGLGAKVALIERHLMGGDCLNYGCVPSKALIRCAKAMADVRNAHALGVHVPEGARVDFAQVMERMRRIRAGISHHDSAARFKELGVDVFLGNACFTGSDTIKVAGTTLRFARAVIATGARAAVPPIPGLAEAGYLTNETVFSLTKIPATLAVIGAGPIGCELAQVFARLGSKVHLIESENRIMPREDPDAAAIVEASMKRDGITIVCGGKAAQVRHDGETKIITLECEGTAHELRVDEILVGVGRAPNVQGMGLDTVGVEFDSRTGVKVNDYLQTTNKRIYAAGDVCFPYKFTHTADAMARIVIGNALFFGRSRTSKLTIPWCTYTDPEVAQVGLTEHEAAKQNIAIDTFRVDMNRVDRAILDSEEEGFLKIHVKKGSDKILGATLVARHAGDMISEITLAMSKGIGLGKVASVIHPYPTQAEVIKRAADAYNRTRLTPFVKKLMSKLLAWRR